MKCKVFRQPVVVLHPRSAAALGIRIVTSVTTDQNALADKSMAGIDVPAGEIIALPHRALTRQGAAALLPSTAWPERSSRRIATATRADRARHDAGGAEASDPALPAACTAVVTARTSTG